MSLARWPSEVPRIPRRADAGHKGSFGRVLIVGGCVDGPLTMLGGPALAALGAIRSGCGLAELAMPAALLTPALTVVPSAVGHAIHAGADGHPTAAALAALAERVAAADAVVVGPGLGGMRVVAACLAARCTVVLDADALNHASRDESLRALIRARTAPTIATPHVGEARRLAEALGIGHEPSAQELAQALGATVVLKSHQTAISDGVDGWSVRAGTAALATGGSGDVLAGVIAGLAAQFPDASSFERCCQAVCLHGLASVAWTQAHGSAGMLATELAQALPAELNRWRVDGTGDAR